MNNVRVKVRVAAGGGAVLGGGRNIGHRAAAGRGSVSAARDNTASTSLYTQAGPCCVPVGRLLQDQEVSIPPAAFVLLALG